MKLAQNSYEKLSKLQRQQQHNGSHPQPPKEVVEACVESFSATQQGLKATGEESDGDKGLIALVCEHDIPIFLANTKTAGEKQYYGLALIHKLFDHLPDNWIIGVLYDVCDNIALFSSFSSYSNDLCSLRLLRQLPSNSAPSAAPFPIPSSPSPLPMTRVLYYGLFLVFPDLCPVLPRICIILHLLLDSLR